MPRQTHDRAIGTDLGVYLRHGQAWTANIGFSSRAANKKAIRRRFRLAVATRYVKCIEQLVRCDAISIREGCASWHKRRSTDISTSSNLSLLSSTFFSSPFSYNFFFFFFWNDLDKCESMHLRLLCSLSKRDVDEQFNNTDFVIWNLLCGNLLRWYTNFDEEKKLIIYHISEKYVFICDILNKCSSIFRKSNVHRMNKNRVKSICIALQRIRVLRLLLAKESIRKLARNNDQTDNLL